MRIPGHIGIIPDGNRRWAQARKLPKEAGYAFGLDPGLQLLRLCRQAGIQELTYYGFTQDNTRRPAVQVRAFQSACVQAVKLISREAGADLLVLGETGSPHFPRELAAYTRRRVSGNGNIRLNFLVNYGWEWDLENARSNACEPTSERRGFAGRIHSSDISRIDLIIRWGGCRRLSGFLPVQSVYADFFVIEAYWPEFVEKHFYDALSWYQRQDVTLGG